MSVLPSFKSAFSSFAEVEVGESVRIADDSGFARPQHASAATNSGPARQSHFQDQFPARTQPSNTWSYLQTTTTGATTVKEQRKPDLIRHPLQSFPSRPAMAPLPLHQLSDQLSDEAPAFGFVSRVGKQTRPGSTARRSIIDPWPSDNLGFPTDGYGVRPESFKRVRSPSVHAGAYKRPRSQSVSAGVSYVRVHSQSSSERLAKQPSPSPSRELSGSAGRQTPKDRLSSASGPVSHSPGSSHKNSATVSGLPSSTKLTRQTGTKSYVRPSAAGISLPRPVSVSRELSEPNQYPRRGTGSGSGSGGHDAQKRNVSPGGSALYRISPSSSAVAPGNARTSSSIPLPTTGKTMNLVSFTAPSFSHRSGGSKGITHGYNTRILPEDDIIEDSTCRVAVDVLSSPRQPSLNSTWTGRTGLLRGALGQTLTLSRGPTASDLSVLLGHTRHDRQDRDEKSTVLDEADTALPERQKQSMTTTESVVGSEGEQLGHKTECGDPMNLSTIVKKPTAGSSGCEYNRSIFKLPRSNMKGAAPALNGQSANPIGSVRLGAATTTNLWGGQGTDGDTGQWNANGELSRDGGQVEAWRQGPKPGVPKPEDKGGVVENGNVNGRIRHETLWGRPVSQEKERGSGSGATGVYCGTDDWSDGGERDGQNGGRVTVTDKMGCVGDDGPGVEGKKNEEGLPMLAGGTNQSGSTGDKSGEECESVQCLHCERRLRNAVTLQNHVRVVHDHSGNFRCEQCGLTFMWRSTLGNHVRLVHEKQRPYDCKECNKAFRWKSHLREHVWVVHKGEKPFQCEMCGKTFGRKNNMQKHMRKHSEVGS